MARKSAKAKRIYEAGLLAYKGEPPASADKMLQAIALMLTEATKKAPAKPAGWGTLPFGPKELYEACLERVPHIIGCEPYDKRWFGRLGKVLQSTNGLEAEDLERFVTWVENGGLEFFEGCTFEHVIKHWSKWIIKARSSGASTAMYKAVGPEEFMR